MNSYETHEIIIDQRKSGKIIDAKLLTVLVEESMPNIVKKHIDEIVFFQFKFCTKEKEEEQ